MTRIVRIEKEEWAQFSENAHLIVFAEKKSADMDRIDFALVAETEDSKLQGYITCREFDAKSLYWQYGGAFPGTFRSFSAMNPYREFLTWSEKRYDRVMTLVENVNYPMLKMHLASGFLIVGFRVHQGQGMVELVKEFTKRGEVGA